MLLILVHSFSRVDCCLQQVKRLSLQHELVEHAIGFQEWNPAGGISFDGKQTPFHHTFFFFLKEQACLFLRIGSQIRSRECGRLNTRGGPKKASAP